MTNDTVNLMNRLMITAHAFMVASALMLPAFADEQANADVTSATQTYSAEKYEAIFSEVIAMGKEEIAILSGIKDKSSADVAAEKLASLYRKMLSYGQDPNMEAAATVMDEKNHEKCVEEILRLDERLQSLRKDVEKKEFYGSTALDEAYDLMRRPHKKKNQTDRTAALDGHLQEFNRLNQEMIDIMAAIKDKAGADAAIEPLYKLFQATDNLQDKIIPFFYSEGEAEKRMQEIHGPTILKHRQQAAKESERLRAADCYGSEKLKNFFKNPRDYGTY